MKKMNILKKNKMMKIFLEDETEKEKKEWREGIEAVPLWLIAIQSFSASFFYHQTNQVGHLIVQNVLEGSELHYSAMSMSRKKAS